MRIQVIAEARFILSVVIRHTIYNIICLWTALGKKICSDDSQFILVSKDRCNDHTKSVSMILSPVLLTSFSNHLISFFKDYLSKKQEKLFVIELVIFQA